MIRSQGRQFSLVACFAMAICLAAMPLAMQFGISLRGERLGFNRSIGRIRYPSWRALREDTRSARYGFIDELGHPRVWISGLVPPRDNIDQPICLAAPALAFRASSGMCQTLLGQSIRLQV